MDGYGRGLRSTVEGSCSSIWSLTNARILFSVTFPVTRSCHSVRSDNASRFLLLLSLISFSLFDPVSAGRCVLALSTRRLTSSPSPALEEKKMSEKNLDFCTILARRGNQRCASDVTLVIDANPTLSATPSRRIRNIIFLRSLTRSLDDRIRAAEASIGRSEASIRRSEASIRASMASIRASQASIRESEARIRASEEQMRASEASIRQSEARAQASFARTEAIVARMHARAQALNDFADALEAQTRALNAQTDAAEARTEILVALAQMAQEARDRMPWKKEWVDKTLSEDLDAIFPPRRPTEKPLRLPVQKVYKIGGIGTVCVGRVESGILKPGMSITFAPQNLTTKVRSIEMGNVPVQEASPGDMVAFNIENVDAKEISRGNVAGESTNDPPKGAAVSFTAEIAVMNHPDQQNIGVGYEAIFDWHTARTNCILVELKAKCDQQSGRTLVENPASLNSGDSGIVRLILTKPMCIESHSDYPPLGRFALFDKKMQIVAVGVIKSVEKINGDQDTSSPAAKK